MTSCSQDFSLVDRIAEKCQHLVILEGAIGKPLLDFLENKKSVTFLKSLSIDL